MVKSETFGRVRRDVGESYRVDPAASMLIVFLVGVMFSASVIVVSLARRTRETVDDTIAAERSDVLIITDLADGTADGFGELVSRLDGVADVAIVVESVVTPDLALARKSNVPWVDSVNFAPPQVFDVLPTSWVGGGPFDQGHVVRGDQVVVLGENLAKATSVNYGPLPDAVMIADQAFTVVGIARFGDPFEEFNAKAFVVSDSGLDAVNQKPPRLLVKSEPSRLDDVALSVGFLPGGDTVTVQIPKPVGELRARVYLSNTGLVAVVASVLSGLTCLILGFVVRASGVRRSKELAMRRALGASSRDVFSLVMSAVSTFSVSGIAFGLVAVGVGSVILRQSLWLPVLETVWLILVTLVVSLMAAAGPALAVSAEDPAGVLRREGN